MYGLPLGKVPYEVFDMNSLQMLSIVNNNLSDIINSIRTHGIVSRKIVVNNTQID